MIEDLYECLEASRTAAEKVLAIQLNYRSILLAGSVYYPDPKNSSELRGENAIHVQRYPRPSRSGYAGTAWTTPLEAGVILVP